MCANHPPSYFCHLWTPGKSTWVGAVIISRQVEISTGHQQRMTDYLISCNSLNMLVLFILLNCKHLNKLLTSTSYLYFSHLPAYPAGYYNNKQTEKFGKIHNSIQKLVLDSLTSCIFYVINCQGEREESSSFGGK